MFTELPDRATLIAIADGGEAVMGIPDIVSGKRNDILRIAAKHGVQRIRVF